MTTIGRIIDVSSNNHPNGSAINWKQVAQAGITAVFVKATEGTNYVNPYFQPDMIAAQNNGIAVCAYHFVDPDTARQDPVTEAQFFGKVASRFARVLDYETNTDVGWAKTFLATLGWPPGACMTYGSASYLKDFYAELPSMAWPAAYGPFYPGWGQCWQFTDHASIPGIVGPVDENRWYGTEAQYDTLFQINIEPPDIGGFMAISATFNHNGQKQVVQCSAGTVWHKWAPFGPSQNETLAGVNGGTAAGTQANKVTVAAVQPGVTVNPDGSVDVTFEGTDGSAWLVSQAAGAAAWTGGKLA